MFWICMMNGAAGHTYGANGIWQNNRPGDPHGKSPHGGSYGKIPWNEAMRLPGSEQVGFGKHFLTQFAWQKFEPHPEWATFASDRPSDTSAAHSDDALYGPQSTGIPGIVRISYVPESRPVTAQGLDVREGYSASYFDPVTGAKTNIGLVRSNDTGTWTCPPPAG